MFGAERGCWACVLDGVKFGGERDCWVGTEDEVPTCDMQVDITGVGDDSEADELPSPRMSRTSLLSFTFVSCCTYKR